MQSPQSEFNLHNQSAISANRLQSPQTDCNLYNQTAYVWYRKVTKCSSLHILQSSSNPRHLNSKAFLDCNGLHLDYMDYKVIKWIAEQYNPKQSKGNLCNPSAIHCNLGLQFCFAIQINLCNLTAIQEDCSLIAEIAVRLLRLQKFRNLHIHIPAPNKVSGMLLGVLFWLLRLQSDCWDCSLIAEIAKVPQLTYTCPGPD